MCGGCEQCLRDQGRWGAICEICGQKVDWDLDDCTKDGEAHLSCLEAVEQEYDAYLRGRTSAEMQPPTTEEEWTCLIEWITTHEEPTTD